MLIHTPCRYMGAKVQVNFGPDLAYPPTDVTFRPMSDAVHLENATLTLAECVSRVDRQLVEAAQAADAGPTASQSASMSAPIY